MPKAEAEVYDVYNYKAWTVRYVRGNMNVLDISHLGRMR
jgi:hypothetical protein